MRSEYLIDKLVASIGRLSEQELRDLANLFRGRDVAEAFGEIVEKTIYLRRIERDKRMRAFSDERNIVRKPDKNLRIRSNKLAKDSFFEILNDRNLFPSTRDVIEILNNIFGLSLQYEHYRKSGRRNLIQKCWRHFEGMPLPKRRNVLRMLSRKNFHGSFPSEGYHELFKILSQK